MTLIRHCIIDTTTNIVVNIIDYETLQTSIPPGFETEAPYLLCVQSNMGKINGIYVNGVIENPPIDKELA